MAIETITGDEIEAKVLRNPGPLALDFYGESCPPCRTLEPRLERIAEQYEGRLPVYRVDAERDLPVAESFGVSSLPTVSSFATAKRSSSSMASSARRTSPTPSTGQPVSDRLDLVVAIRCSLWLAIHTRREETRKWQTLPSSP